MAAELGLTDLSPASYFAGAPSFRRMPQLERTQG
jgi:hypothetical protein